MFNIVTRFQNISNHVLTSTFIISFLIMAIAYVQLLRDNVWSITSDIDNISASASIKHSFNYGAVNRKPKENSKIQFDLDADLTPLFNWNTKQIFVYLTAEYPGKSDGSSNKVTYWDKIITDKESSVLSLKNVKSKYSVWDVEKSFRNRDAIVRLEWNIQPHIGALIYGETISNSSFQFVDPKSK